MGSSSRCYATTYKIRIIWSSMMEGRIGHSFIEASKKLGALLYIFDRGLAVTLCAFDPGKGRDTLLCLYSREISWLQSSRAHLLHPEQIAPPSSKHAATPPLSRPSPSPSLHLPTPYHAHHFHTPHPRLQPHRPSLRPLSRNTLQHHHRSP